MWYKIMLWIYCGFLNCWFLELWELLIDNLLVMLQESTIMLRESSQGPTLNPELWPWELSLSKILPSCYNYEGNKHYSHCVLYKTVEYA